MENVYGHNVSRDLHQLGESCVQLLSFGSLAAAAEAKGECKGKSATMHCRGLWEM